MAGGSSQQRRKFKRALERALAAATLLDNTTKKPEQTAGQPKTPQDPFLSLGDSFAILGLAVAILLWIFLPTTVTRVIGLLIVTGCFFHLSQKSHWSKKLSVLQKRLVTVACVLVVLGGGGWLLYKQETFHPARLSMRASLIISPEEGATVDGITWKKEFQDIRIEINSQEEYPLRSVDLTVQAVDDKDIFLGMGQISDLSGVEFHPPKLPPLSAVLRDENGQKFEFNPFDFVKQPFFFGRHWGLFCPNIPTGAPLVISLVAFNKVNTTPKRLKISGSYEVASSEGNKLVKVENFIYVAR
jgi:hypothetical protein